MIQALAFLLMLSPANAATLTDAVPAQYDRAPTAPEVVISVPPDTLLLALCPTPFLNDKGEIASCTIERTENDTRCIIFINKTLPDFGPALKREIAACNGWPAFNGKVQTTRAPKASP